MVQLQTSLKEIEATGGHIVGISYDSTAILKRFAAKNGIRYRLLSDVGSKTIDAYGIRNKEAPERWSGIRPPPGFTASQFVIGLSAFDFLFIEPINA